MRRLAVALLGLACVACDAAAEQDGAFPWFEAEGGRVRDGAQVLSPDAELELAAKLDRAEAAYGQEMGIVTVDSLHEMAIEDFSLQYASAWGLGNVKRDDGLMLLVAPNERKVRIEIGRGLEQTFPDEWCQQVLDEIVLPAFRAGDYERGVIAGSDALMTRMEHFPTRPANDNEASPNLAESAA